MCECEFRIPKATLSHEPNFEQQALLLQNSLVNGIYSSVDRMLTLERSGVQGST